MDKLVDIKNIIDTAYNYIIHSHDINDVLESKKGSNALENILTILDQYQYTFNEEDNKGSGRFYTDKSIVEFILNRVLGDVDIVSNPYIRILDPSCGCGYFLLKAYEILKNKYIENLSSINRLYPNICMDEENVHDHIIKYNLFGSDLDEYGAKLAVIGLMLKNKKSKQVPNIICCDSVINWEDTIFKEREFWQKRFDIIVGNPPYIGHKKLSGEYRKVLNDIYGDVFKDKADISFCFIKSSIDRLSLGGKLGFITSRYFVESPSGKKIRSYIKQKSKINSIIDFYGVRIMKGISVDPAILFLEKSPSEDNKVKVLRAEHCLKGIDIKEIFNESVIRNRKYYKSFEVSQASLEDDGWILRNDLERSIVRKIEGKLKLRLEDICCSFQGIITGCDKAFIVDDAAALRYNIEKNILRRWIKNSHIKKFKVEHSSFYIIYSDSIKEPSLYPNAISHIREYKERLQKRRECIKGIRKWYELQWGRESSLFESRKIVFPYKSSSNRFALDEGSYSSADVYGLLLKDEYISQISYEFLLGILNSSLYEFYFKSFGKKLGDDLYDYYPNSVMRLMIPHKEDLCITNMVKSILSCNDENEVNSKMADLDKYIYNFFELTEEEIKIINSNLAKVI